MANEVTELADAVVRAGSGIARSYEEGDLDTARELARLVLSAGSKLHARLGILQDLRREGIWTAAVDRALRRPELPPEIPGQESLPVPTPEPKKPPTRRGRKG